MLLQEHEGTFISEETMFKTIVGDQIEVGPTTMSTTPNTMNEVTGKFISYVHV